MKILRLSLKTVIRADGKVNVFSEKTECNKTPMALKSLFTKHLRLF